VEGGREVSDFGVLFHELAHSLYESETADFQNEWEGYFRSSKSLFAEPAYALINEALATALGNGWAEEKLGSLRTGKWYDDPYLDAFSRALYPEVKARVEGGRRLDKDFAQKAIAALELAVPEAPFEYGLRLKKVVLLADSRLEIARKELRRRFSVQSLRANSPLSGASALGDVKRTRDALVIVVSRKAIAELEALEQVVPGLKFPWASLRGRVRPVVFSVLHGDRPVILIRADTDVEIAEGFERVRRAKRIDPKRPLLPELTEPA
jgi:hypothetical protein